MADGQINMALRNAKAKGSRNERRSIEILEAAGYRCTKAGGSLGVFDIIGIGSADAVAVQCKSNRWPPPHECEQMELFKVPANFRKLIHRWNDRQRMPDVREIE